MSHFKQYLPLCWFAENPLDLPASISFFKQNLFFYFGLELFTQINMIDAHEALLEVTIETSLTLLFVAIVLLLNKSFHAYIPIATAVLFTENIVAVFGLPTMIWLAMTEHELSYLTMFLLVVWDFALMAYIFQKCLGINLLAGWIVSIIYFFSTYGAAYSITFFILG